MVNNSSDDKSLKEISNTENGGKIIFATDDFFAVAENLLKPEEPIWNDNFTEFGKWMDGWETRRKRIAGHDWVIIALGFPSVLHSAYVDTGFFTGNYAPKFSLQGANISYEINTIQNRQNKIGTAASKEEMIEANKLHSEIWKTLIPLSPLDKFVLETQKKHFDLSSMCGDRVFTHVRLNIFPDGGIARLRVYGKPARKSESIKGECIDYSNAHFAHPGVLLNPLPSKGMQDGWETARKAERPLTIEIDDSGFVKTYNEEWVILKLDKAVFVRSIEVDTTHFKGNCPDSVKIEGTYLRCEQDLKCVKWIELLNRTKLMPHRSNGLVNPVIKSVEQQINHVKVTIEPDGGLARIRIYGDPENI